MDKKSKTGGTKDSATIFEVSRKAKQDISFVPRMLTPSEQDFLRQDLRETIEIAKKVKVA
jgi:hypothetical protein